MRSVRQRQLRISEGVFNRHPAGHGEEHVVPDAGIAAADGGDPVPADRRMEGGVVEAERAAVLAGALEGLLRDGAGGGVFQNAYGECALASGGQLAGDVEASAGEGAFDAAEFLAIKVDVGLPVDAGEIQ